MKNRRGGFIGTIVLIILGLAALKYFLNWDVFDAASSEQGKGTIAYIRDIVNTVWSYIGTPLSFAWNEVAWPIIKIAWDNLQSFIDWARENANKGI